MAKTKREYILASCFLSGAAAVVSFLSLGTQYWVVSEGVFTENNDGINNIRYGLFSGILNQKVVNLATYQLEMTCLIGDNVCALLCGSDSDRRTDQLKQIYDDQEVSFDVNCPQVKSIFALPESIPIVKASKDYDKRFINAGVWITTILFLSLSGVMGIVAAALAVYNFATNPIQYYLSTYGLYIYNAIALGATLIVLFSWGLMFATTTIHNVAILYTLTNLMKTSKAELGYSYWLNILSMLLYIFSICVLYLRQYLIAKEPKTTLDVEENADPALYLY